MKILGMGVDVSHWQGFVDWQKVVNDIHAKGYYAFGIVKTSGGDAGFYQDAQYINNKNNARQFCDAVGFYHFMGTTFTPTQEADFFLKTINGDIKQGEFLCMDAEKGQTDAQKLAFEAEVKRLAQVNGLDYPSDTDQVLHTANYGTWAARYGWNLGGVPSSLFYPKGVYVIWQFTSKGSVDGITGKVDMDLTQLPLGTLKKYGKQ